MSKATRKTTRPDLPAEVSRTTGWRRARHVLDPGTTKVPARRITINIDEDIIAIFKAEAFRGGPPYQIAINQALRRYLRERQRSEREHAADLVLKALEDESVIARLRRIR